MKKLSKILLIIVLSLFTISLSAKERHGHHKDHRPNKTELLDFIKNNESEYVLFVLKGLEETEFFNELNLDELYYDVYGVIYEEPILPERWMFMPFTKTFEEPLVVEEWMTKPFVIT